MAISNAAAFSPAKNPALVALCTGNFLVGTGVMLPGGLMNEIAANLSVSVTAAGALVGVGAVAIGLGSPLMSALTTRVDRRILLALCLALYGLLYLLSALAPNFDSLLALRAACLIAVAAFTPQAAASAGVMAGPEHRAGAVVFVFLGWSIASVAGMPLGALAGAYTGWRVAFAGFGVLTMLGALWVWRAVPRGIAVPPLSFAAWKAVLTHPALLLTLAVTALSSAGQFTHFTYWAPVFKSELNAQPWLISSLFAFFGVFGVLGTMLAAKHINRIGAARMILLLLTLMLASLLLWPAVRGIVWLTLLPLALWGLACFSTNSSQQARLMGIAPALASASIALNTTMIYLGQAAGAFSGGALVQAGAMHLLTWVGAAVMLAAMAVSTLVGDAKSP
jgi:MFS transporter, DHA1 family, inner membrane transport protein